ncbi:MAG TPA: methyltransferase domain-containing protein [Trebonia sp.]|jgi:SAM-dependent methyltransferase
MPEVYTHGHNESVLRSHAWRTAENSAAYLLPHLEPDHRLLDVGCGAGTITTGFTRYVPDGHVTGIDAGEGVIVQARAAVASAAGSGSQEPVRNVDFATGDVYALDFPDGSFDVTHAHQVLQHLGDPVRALREMRRVTKPGGIVAVRDADYGAMFWYPLIDALEEWRNLYRAVARGNGGEPDAARRLHVWARAAGLTDVTVSSSTWTYSTPEERDWWGGTWADRTIEPPYSEGALAGGHATTADLGRIAAAWRDWAADEDGWFCVVNGELICRVPE